MGMINAAVLPLPSQSDGETVLLTGSRHGHHILSRQCDGNGRPLDGSRQLESQTENAGENRFAKTHLLEGTTLLRT